MNITSGQLTLNLTSGDLYIGGSWTRASGGVFVPNNRAVFFNGTSTSVITGNGGETFSYLVNDKTSGTIQLGSNVTLTAPNGGNALTHKSTASLNLNGYDITFSGPNNSTILADGACSVTGTGNVFITSNSKVLTAQNSGSWTFGSSVVIRLQNGLNFGNSISTVNGTLEINSGGYVSDYAPAYGTGSTLKYNSGTTYGRNTEWYSNLSNGIGVPHNVLISSNTTVNLGANGNHDKQSWVRNELKLDGSLDLSLLGDFSMPISAPLNIEGSVLFNGGTLKLSGTAGGDIKVKGDWSGTGTFIPNSRAVYLQGTNNQTISRADNFPYLIIDKSQGNVTFAANVTLNNKLTYTDGGISILGGSIDASGASAEIEFANSSSNPFTLPSGIFNGTVNKITMNGAGGITLTENIKVKTLTMTNGNITVPDNINILEIGTNPSNPGLINWTGGSVIGPMKRWFGASINSTQESGIFPLGTSSGLNRYAQVNFTSAPAQGGYIIAEYKEGLPNTLYDESCEPFDPNNFSISEVLWNGLPATIHGQLIENYEEEGYWDITPYDEFGDNSSSIELNNTTYNLKLRGNNLSTANDFSLVRLIRSPGPNHCTWEGATAHVGSSGTNSDFTITSSLTGFSWFNMGGGDNNPLPVELTSFNASCEDEGIVLNWSTASENNSSHFDIEKSENGTDWRVIGSVQAAGNSAQDIHYSFLDSEKLNGANYYRLNQVDIDGNNKFYGPIQANCESEEYINSYPNPSKNEFNLLLKTKSNGSATLKIVDATGVIVSNKGIQLNDGINLFTIHEKLNSGIYFIQILTDSGKVFSITHSVN